MQKRRLGIAVITAMLFAINAAAEPSNSGAHVPILLTAVVTLAALVGGTPYALMKLGILKLNAKTVIIVGIVLAIAFAVLAGPFILAVGSIFLTGRTM